MMTFDYKIKDHFGVNVKPALAFAKIAEGFNSKIEIQGNHSCLEATRLTELIALGIKQGDTISVLASGEDEEAAIQAMLNCCEENL